jgi:hypothetical protein
MFRTLFRRVPALQALLLFLFALAFIGQPMAAYAAPTAGVSADVVGRATGTYFGSNGNGSPAFSFDVKNLVQFAAGTGLGQADLMFSDSRTIAASGTDPLNLTATLKDPLGATITMVHVKAILIVAASTNTNNVVIGNAASHPIAGIFAGTTPTIAIPPGGSFLFTSLGVGVPLVASTSDQLGVANSSSGSTVTYKVIIIGTST